MNSMDLIELWTNFLPIANLAFAIVFAVVIYSTATGQGLTNYSVKKILPRLVITAIGVNVSFYLCAILADAINIVAVGVPSLIFNGEDWQGVSNYDFAGAVGSLGGAFVAVIVVMLFWSIALVAILVTVLALSARQILLSMLVVISPLAVVCAVLPATQKWFEKWAKTYIQLLAVYPMFMLVWAGCAWFQGNIDEITNPNNPAGVVIAFLVKSIAPLIPAVAIYPLLKASGGVMGKLTGAIDKSPLGTQGALGKRAKESDANRRLWAANQVRNMPGRTADKIQEQLNREQQEQAEKLNQHRNEAEYENIARDLGVVNSDGGFVEGNGHMTKEQYDKAIKQEREKDVALAYESLGQSDSWKQRSEQLSKKIDRNRMAGKRINSMVIGRQAAYQRNKDTKEDLDRQGVTDRNMQESFRRFGGATAAQRGVMSAAAQAALDEAAVKASKGMEVELKAKLANSTDFNKDIENELKKAIMAGDNNRTVAVANVMQSKLGNGAGARILNTVADDMEKSGLSASQVSALRSAQNGSSLSVAINERNPLRAMAAQNNMSIDQYVSNPERVKDLAGRVSGSTASDIANFKPEYIKDLVKYGLHTNLPKERVQEAIAYQKRNGIGDQDMRNSLNDLLGRL